MTSGASKRFQEAMAKFNSSDSSLLSSPAVTRKPKLQKTFHMNQWGNDSFSSQKLIINNSSSKNHDNIASLNDSITINTEISCSSSHTDADQSCSWSNNSDHYHQHNSYSRFSTRQQLKEEDRNTNDVSDDCRNCDDPDHIKSYSAENRFTSAGRPNDWVGGYSPEYIFHYRQQKLLREKERPKIDLYK